MSTVEPLGRGPDRAARARAGDALELPRLRDERDRLARAAGRARRPQAGAPARPLRDARGRACSRTAPYKKCARDRRRRDGRRTTRTATPAIYDTLVRMAQPFSLRYPLVDGQGNFGNIDGDPAAADALHRVPARRASRPSCCATSTPTPSTSSRTTTSRAREPAVLPARFPNLLVNGSSRASRSGWRRTCRRTTSREIDRRGRRDDRRADDRRRAALHAAHEGPGLPDRRRSSSAATGSARPTAPAAAGSSCARAPTSRSCAAARARSSSPSCPYGVKKGGDDGVIKKIADLVKDKVLTEISRPRRPLRQVGHADPDRAEARRDPAGRAQQALQAHAAADDVRLQRRRARRRRAADALAARADHALPRLPARGRHPPARSTSCARPRTARTSSRAT